MDEHSEYYLITCKHVIKDADKFDSNLDFTIRDKTDVDDFEWESISLRDQNEPKWLEHSNEEVDIAAVKVDINLKETGNNPYNTLESRSSSVGLMGGDLAHVVGYPLSFKDQTTFLPVIRRGMIASPYGKPFNDEPHFILDAPLHPGMSGSPVVAVPDRMLSTTTGMEVSEGIRTSERGNPELIGVCSAGIEELGLHRIWYSRLIKDIVEDKDC